MPEQIHWIVRAARAGGMSRADDLALSPRAEATEAWDAVTEACGVDESTLAQAIADWFRLDVADLASADPVAVHLLPGNVARRFGVFPLHVEERHLHVATANPCDVGAEQQVGFASGRLPIFQIASPGAIAHAIDDAYSPNRAVSKLLDRIDPEQKESPVTVIEEEVEEEPRAEADVEPLSVEDDEESEGPIVRLANMILDDAVAKGASDIHLQPTQSGGVIRLRIDGVLRSGISVPAPVLGRVISRIKIMSRLDISDKMRPQDGRARIRVGGHRYDLRVSTVPVRGGEKAVIRILDPSGSGALDSSGIPSREVERLRRILRNHDGILVVTGPTGSGKTTTMYAALREISSEDLNIMTVEDPVEYELAGLTQIQVDPKKGVTFHTALRAILRQDPDVIFVGEIRDEQTAEMAAQASLTGHLVLATVHANDAVGAIRRFLDLGLDAGTISEVLRGALAQRLVRTLCDDCAQPADEGMDAEERRLWKQYGVLPTRRSVGCETCGYSGFRGRRPVVELFAPTPELLRLVSQEASHLDLTMQARQDGMATLLEGALDLVEEGRTTLVEVERVIGEEAAAPDAARPPDPPATVVHLPGTTPEPPPPEPSATEGPPQPAAPRRSVVVSAPTPAAAPPSPDPDAPPTRVLVVDDDPGTRVLLKAVLESHGWIVEEAADGKEALMAIGRGKDLSLMILDLGLPDLDGEEILKSARRNMETASLPIIVLTGRTDRESERRLLMNGADDYIRKPLDAPIFLTRAKAVLRRTRDVVLEPGLQAY